MQLALDLCLPRDAATVPVARRVLDGALTALGVTAGCRQEVQLAVAEACANAVKHAAPASEYQLTVTVDDGRCMIDVADSGRGFEPEGVSHARPAPLRESGRGLHIIRAVTDEVRIDATPSAGVAVRFVKRLDYEPNAPALTLRLPGAR